MSTEKERLANWMIMNGFATGHGDSFEDLLKELTWQVGELRNTRRDLEIVRHATSRHLPPQ